MSRRPQRPLLANKNAVGLSHGRGGPFGQTPTGSTPPGNDEGRAGDPTAHAASGDRATLCSPRAPGPRLPPCVQRMSCRRVAPFSQRTSCSQRVSCHCVTLCVTPCSQRVSGHRATSDSNLRVHPVLVSHAALIGCPIVVSHSAFKGRPVVVSHYVFRWYSAIVRHPVGTTCPVIV